MRTNVVLDEDLVEEATRLTGIRTKRELLREALRVLIAAKRRKSLLDLRGKIEFATAQFPRSRSVDGPLPCACVTSSTGRSGPEEQMRRHGIEVPQAALADFCQRHGIRRLALFGSLLHGDFGPQSDVDVLVEFFPGQTPGLLRMVAMEQELTSLLGRKVDLRTPHELSRHFREEVLREAETWYAAA